MAQWQRRLNLQPEWGKAQEGEISVHEMAGIVAQRLKALTPFDDFADIEERREDLVYEFDGMSRDPELDVREFDEWMEELFDWGDTPLDDRWNGRKVCWVNVIV